MKFTVTTFFQREIPVFGLTKNLGPFLGRKSCLWETWFACQRTGVPGRLGSLWGPQKRTVELKLSPKPCDFGGADRGTTCLTQGPSLRKSFSAPITSPTTPPLLPKTPLYSPPPSLPPEEEGWFLGTIIVLLHLLPRNQLAGGN